MEHLRHPTPEEVDAAVEASVFRSCRELRMYHLPFVLLHRAQDRTRHSGLIWRRLLELRDEGIIGALGVSVYTPDEAKEALEDPDVELIQLPYNLLDWRWKENDFDQRLMREGLVIHVRSVLLQGLLAKPEQVAWPAVPGLDVQRLQEDLTWLVNHLNRESVVDLALAYVRGHAWIDGLVLGMETMEQLMTNLRLFQTPALTSNEIELVDRTVERVPEQLLNPSRWPQRRGV